MKKIISALLAVIMAFGSMTVFAAEKGETSLQFRGVDVSSYFAEKNSGVVYRDFSGKALDDDGFFELLKNCGINSVRVRIWNNPYDSDGNGYGGGNCDIENACKIGSLAAKHNISVFADFHLSDFWCDPEKQKAPKEWQNYSVSEKTDAIYDFVYTSLNKLIDSGADVKMVQVGNEINSGMCGETDFANVCKLLKSGFSAVQNVDKNILRAVHFTNPEKNGYEWYAGQLDKNGVDYEVFASSYYSYWHGTAQNLTTQLSKVAEKYGKYVIAAETSYPFTSEDSDFFGNTVSGTDSDMPYPVNADGQAQAVTDVFDAVSNVGEKGLGVYYWEPAWITVGTNSYEDNLAKWEKFGSGWESSFAGSYCDDGAKYFGGSSWDNQAMFDKNGNPLQSLNVFGNYADVTTGDVDLDGVVTVKDATLVQKDIVQLETLTGFQKKIADSNLDGSINITDATAIQKTVVKLN